MIGMQVEETGDINLVSVMVSRTDMTKLRGLLAQIGAEVWIDMPGYEGLYALSNQGRMMGLSEGNHGQFKVGRILKPILDKNGYFYYTLFKGGRKNQHRIHRIVMEGFGGVPLTRQHRYIVHRDLNRSNNRIENLQWSKKPTATAQPAPKTTIPVKPVMPIAVNIPNGDHISFEEAAAFTIG